MFFNQSRFGQVHKVLSGSSEAVAGGAERRDVSELGNVVNHFIEGAMVAESELGLVEDFFSFCIAAWVGFAAGGNLRDAEGEGVPTHIGIFAGGHDDAGIGDGQTQNGYNFAKVKVADGHGGMDGHFRAGGRFQTGDADGMRADAKFGFEMADVLHHGQYLKSPVAESEEHADSNIVDAGLHGAIHGGYSPVVINLFAGQMDLPIGLAMIGFLEKLVGSDMGVF